MVNYSFSSDDPRLAQIRAQAQALRERDLARTVTTQAGTFNVGKGYSVGANRAFLDEVARRGGITRAEEFGITGNISRNDKATQELITQLENNRAHKNVQDIKPMTLPASTYETLIGSPQDLTPQHVATQQSQNQTDSQLLNIAPRQDPIDVLAPSILPSLTPPSYIPTNAYANNLVNVDAESGTATDTVTGDTYIPEDTTDAYSNDYVDPNNQTVDTSSSDQSAYDQSAYDQTAGMFGV